MLNRCTRLSLLAILTASLGLAGTARAEEEAAADDAAATDTAAADDTASADDGSASDTDAKPTASVGAAPAEAPASSWPLAIRDRPLTLPKGVFSAGVSAAANNDFSVIGASATGLWGLSYGISDDLTVGVAYGLGIEPSSDGKGPLDVIAAYTYYAKGALILTATASTGYDLSGEVMNPLSLGTMAWYNIGDKLTILTPGGQLAIGLEDPNPIALSLPVSVGYQVNPNLFATLDTSLGDIAIKEGDSAIFGADVVPVGVTGWYSPSNKMDLALHIGTDLKNEPGDSLEFGLLFIYYGGV